MLARFPRFAILLAGLSALAWPLYTAAHEPITTKVRFNKEVIRILRRNCLGCHRPEGAAMSLATYDDARPWAKAIKEEILEKRMPPWHAVKGYGDFLNAPSLTQREVDLIVNWVEGGAPKGDDKDLPSEPLYSDDWALGKPGLVLEPEREFNVASDSDERQSFMLPTNFKENRWLSALDLRPGNRSVVHCATLHLEAKKGEGTESAVLGAWMPGQKPVAYPKETARLLPAGSRLRLEIHYRGAGEDAKDKSQVGLYFAPAPPARQAREIALEIPLNDPKAEIPAGAALHRVSQAVTLSEGAEAVAIRPSVNPLLVSMQASAQRPDGTEEVLIWTRGHHLAWQPTYYFRRPVALPKGTRIEVIAHFDNSEANRDNPNSPPVRVRWSDLSPDPLCALVISTSRAGND